MSKALWPTVHQNILNSELQLRKVLKDGQFEALCKVSESLKTSGVILADEVGLGKTFVALALVEYIVHAGGTVGILVPPGLMFQWEAEIKKFKKLFYKEINLTKAKSNWEPLKISNYFNFADNAEFDNNKRNLEPLVTTQKRPVALISHRFTAPYVRGNSRLYAYHLPSLYWGAVQELNNGSTNELKYWKHWQKLDGPTYLDNLCKYLRSAKIDWTPEELDYLKNDDYRVLISSIGKDRKSVITSTFGVNQMGHKIQSKLIGHGIGNLDLVIIDEAHKNKGDEDHSTELSRLLTTILNPNQSLQSDNRILGMTATPVELSSQQWLSLMKRIGVAEVIRNTKAKVIESFTEQLDRGRTHPDNVEIISKLILESKSFESCMKDVVFRRRKHDLESFKEITKASNKNSTSHPNRRLNDVKIKFENLSSQWKSSVLAFEGIGKAAKGLSESTALKLLDSRYPSGLLPQDLLVSKNKETTENTDPAEAAQLGRIDYWKNILKEFGEAETNEEAYLNNHPRIQAAADHIDQIIFNSEGELTNEKVLVFGTFTKPLRALRNVLNYRYILRQIDSGLPVRAPEVESFDFENLYKEYLQLTKKQNQNLNLKNLKSDLKITEFKKLIESVRNDYDNLQKSLNKFFRESKSTGINNDFFELLPGNESLAELNKAGKISEFYSFLESYVLSEILQSAELYNIYKQEDKFKADKITEIATQVWTSFILAQTDISDTELTENTDTKWTDEKQKKADSIGDKLSIQKILEIIQSDETTTNPNRSNFCRFMNGETKMTTRRTLQLQFNNITANPKVLIAQSMVGREGLNLHEACRRVVIFHPEWNPAVVEQQIGRVDRINSRWEELAKAYYKLSEDKRGEYPYIEVDFLIFEGTYDQYQFERMKYRRENMAAQLFGALLPEDVLQLVPEYLKVELALAAPDFSPMKITSKLK